MSKGIKMMRTQIEDQAAMKLVRAVIERVADRAPEFIDITDEIERVLLESEIREGSVCVFSKHTTAAIKINENEPLLLRDMSRFLAAAAPKEAEYRHNDFVIRTANMTEDECPNGHSHCQHLLLGTSETIPVCDGQLMLGRWQRVFLIELDRPRQREVVIQIQGW